MNISQKRIRLQIIAYLSAKGRSKRFISQFKDGYCNGLAVLGVYASYLSSMKELDALPPPLDDWAWFESILLLLDNWNEKLSSLTPNQCEAIDRLISIIEYFQHIHDYLPIGQSSLHKSLFDTSNRQLSLEFTIGGLFTAANFNETLTIDNQTTSLLQTILKHDKRLILINTGWHTTSLFRDGDTIYFYNPNNKNGRQPFALSDITSLIKAIFSAYGYQRRKPSPLGFRVFTFDQAVKDYVAPDKILVNLSTPDPPPEKINHRGITGLHVAACVGNIACIAHYLQNGVAIDAMNRANETPLYLAITRKHDKTVEYLVKAGAQINTPTLRHKTPLSNAADKQDITVVLCLLKYGNDADFNSVITALTHLQSTSLREQLLDGILSSFPHQIFGHPDDLRVKLDEYERSPNYQLEIGELLRAKLMDECQLLSNRKYIADIFRFYRPATANPKDQLQSTQPATPNRRNTT